MPETRTLSLWRLYESPGDAPGSYVLRRFEIWEGDQSLATNEAYFDGDPERLRRFARERGLVCIPPFAQG